MIDPELLKEILITCVGTLLAAIFALVAWIFKLAYERHVQQKTVLSMFEHIFVVNFSLLKDNFDFISKWVESLKINRPYSFHFENFLINEDEVRNLGNLKLVNQVLRLNYMLKRTGSDINNIYKSYWEVIYRIDAITDIQDKIKELEHYHGTVIKTLEDIKSNYRSIENSIIEVTALIRVVNTVRTHSFFGYLSLLFKDVLPRVNELAINDQIKILKDNIDKIK